MGLSLFLVWYIFFEVYKLCLCNKNYIIHQVFEDLPQRLFENHDVPVDIIVTPTQVIHVEKPLKKPTGLIWDLLCREKFFRVAILKPIYEKSVA